MIASFCFLRVVRHMILNYMFSLQPLFTKLHGIVECMTEKYIFANNTVIECDLNQLQTSLLSQKASTLPCHFHNKSFDLQVVIKEPR